jgi:hypothetical protein
MDAHPTQVRTRENIMLKFILALIYGEHIRPW